VIGPDRSPPVETGGKHMSAEGRQTQQTRIHGGNQPVHEMVSEPLGELGQIRISCGFDDRQFLPEEVLILVQGKNQRVPTSIR